MTYGNPPLWELHVGDALAVMRTMPDASVQCVVTSPPYYNLRSYLPADHVDKPLEIGTEATPSEYVSNLVNVFREVRRVLRDDGTLWVNIADSYSFGKPKDTNQPGLMRGNGQSRLVSKIPAKNLLMIPARVAIALQEDGWYLRAECVWNKPNPMPSSAKDRPCVSHEMIYMLAKRPSYFYDAKAIAEERTSNNNSCGRNSLANVDRRPRGSTKQDAIAAGTYETFNERWKGREVGTRNRRSVWTITPRGFSGEHYACFPPGLPQICIRAGSRPGDTVLDPFTGSGTTGMVAIAEGRRFVGIELNPTYAKLVQRRICDAKIPFPGFSEESGGGKI